MRRFTVGEIAAYLATYAPIPLFIWLLVVSPWRAAYRPLADLTQASGPLETAAIQRSTDKTHSLYLAITLRGYPQEFGIRDNQSEQSLGSLQSQLHRGQRVAVWYEPEWNMLGLGSVRNFSIYQVESADRVVYGLTEVRQRYLNHVAWGLVALCVVGLPVLSFYLRRHAES